MGSFLWSRLAREAELRHPQAVIPGPQPGEIETPRLGQFLVQEPFALMMLQRVGEELLVGRLGLVPFRPEGTILTRITRIFGNGPQPTEVTVIADINGHIHKSDAVGGPLAQNV